MNVQPYFGSSANFAVFTGLLPPHSGVMGLDLPSGGHFTHSYCSVKKKISAMSIYLVLLPNKVYSETGLIDADKFRESALVFQPVMMLRSASAFLRVIGFVTFWAIADGVGALLMADVAYISGLVAVGQYPSLFEHCVVIMMTHTLLRGSRAGIFFFKCCDKIPDIGAHRHGGVPWTAGRAAQPPNRRPHRTAAGSVTEEFLLA